MKLPVSAFNLASALQEFDVWITPSLGEIRDTKKFELEMQRIVYIFNILSDATGNFNNVRDCVPSNIASMIVKSIKNLKTEEQINILQSLASAMYLVSGKSDNNVKCQLPIYLRDKCIQLFTTKMNKEKNGVEVKAVPIKNKRTLTSVDYMNIIGSLKPFPDIQERLLHEFIAFILSDEKYISQLWCIGNSFTRLKSINKERDLLSPLVIFQVRGSVSASGGHGPEEMLRSRLSEWGLQEGIDYNRNDVIVESSYGTIIEDEEDGQSNDETNQKKTRAYDFVLPFRTDGWHPRVFIQSQYYAGDSGSVSHKNVDQTASSRPRVLQIYKDAIFVEYVDGAGYFSSLNGDLKKLLAMPTTADFFQIRSSSIRLRRILQSIGYLTTIEIEHAVFMTNGKIGDVIGMLLTDGYTEKEVMRSIKSSVDRGLININDDVINICPERLTMARRYFLLDTIAKFGNSIPAGQNLAGTIIIPGYGPFYGKSAELVVKNALDIAPILKEQWSEPTVLLSDIGWVCKSGSAISH